ncbi:MAG: ATP-binding protein [Dissulfurispiraceae bacterium]
MLTDSLITTSLLQILHLEDDPLDAELVRSTLDGDGIACKIFRVETRHDFVTAIERGGFDIIFADYSLPAFDGISALAIARIRRPFIPFIFVSGAMGEELAIETLKSGATDYVLKSRISRLIPSVRRALDEAKERSDRRKAVKELRHSREQLRNLAEHLQTVREEERTWIAREIHDELGQALTAFKMDLSMMEKKIASNQDIGTLRELVKTDIGLVDTTIQTVKRLCSQLRPALLDHLGLGAALEWQAEEFQKRNAIECKVDLVPSDITVDEKYSTSLFRIFQESLTNVLRHAEATKVTATLSDEGDSIILEIADNGVGITKENLSKNNSFGLLGMRERVQICNGEVRITGSQGVGTTITVIIPKDKDKQ